MWINSRCGAGAAPRVTLTCEMPADCSLVETLISEISCDTFITGFSNSSIEPPATAATRDPCSTFSTLSAISVLTFQGVFDLGDRKIGAHPVLLHA